MQFAENDLDNRIPAGHAAFFNSFPYTRLGYSSKVSEQTIYVWRRKFGTLEPADVKRLRSLETENAKLKKLLAERDLEIDTMKEINRRKW